MTAREDIRHELPFWVNGTLDAETHAAVGAAIAADPVLAAEARALAAIRAGMQAEPQRSPGEFGLARLMRDIGAAERAGGGSGGGQKPFWSRPGLWQAAAAVAMLALVGQGLWLRATPGSDGTQAGFDLAGAVVADADFRVAFAPGASEAAMRQLLLDAGVEIVAGPSALGLYTLAVVSGDGDEDRVQARAILDAAPDVIESVEDADG